jgi:RND family efflux transporter MFP subunit
MKTSNLVILFALALFFNACQQNQGVEAKKEELKSKKKELQQIQVTITELEKEISSLDPEFARKNRKATLVTTTPVNTEHFEHFIEVSGAVKSRRNVLVSAENMGRIESIQGKEGDEVRKGQLVISLDTELYERNLDQLQTEYELAKTMYQKQSNLWEQNIGTEVQYLEAKNRKESLENQIANIKTQISKSKVRAPFPGTIDEVFVKLGEMAQIGSPLFRIVNHKDMYVTADLSEAYIGDFDKGNTVMIYFPSVDETIESKISSVGQVIDEMNRTFSIEALLPDTDFKVKPNLIAVLKMRDYEQENAVVVPSKLIQKDNRGDFLYVVEKDSNELIAKKVKVERGITYKNRTQIKSGLAGGETLVDQGFRDVAHGSKVKIAENVL